MDRMASPRQRAGDAQSLVVAVPLAFIREILPSLMRAHPARSQEPLENGMSLDIKLPLYLDGCSRLRDADGNQVTDYDLAAINGALAALPPESPTFAAGVRHKEPE